MGTQNNAHIAGLLFEHVALYTDISTICSCKRNNVFLCFGEKITNLQVF